MEMARAGSGRVQREAASEGKTIQHLRPRQNHIADDSIIRLLVEVHPRFVPGHEVDLELQAVQFRRYWSGQYAGQDSVRVRQPFELSRGRFVAFDDCPRREPLV